MENVSIQFTIKPGCSTAIVAVVIIAKVNVVVVSLLLTIKARNVTPKQFPKAFAHIEIPPEKKEKTIQSALSTSSIISASHLLSHKYKMRDE